MLDNIPYGTEQKGGNNQLQQERALAEKAFRSLQEAIVNGKLRPNQRLVESRIAKKLGMSRTPIREALSRLESTAYVSRLPNGGMVVVEYSPRQINELFEIREALEVMAIKLACLHCKKEDLERIVELRDLVKEQILNRDVEQFTKLNNQFHECIYAYCGNRKLIEFIHLLRDQYFIQRVMRTFTGRDWQTTLKQHDKIVEALLKRDGKKAQKVTENHLKRMKREALRRL